MSDILGQLEQLLGQKVKKNEPLSQHNSLKIGGLAHFYLEIDNLEKLIEVIRFSQQRDLPYVVIGGGTHVVFPENGFDGLVIQNKCRRFELVSVVGKIKSQKMNVDKAFLYAESGAFTNQVVRYSIEQGFAGLEYALGLPGTIGGAIATNADFPPQEFTICSNIHRVKILTNKCQIKEVGEDYFHSKTNTRLLKENNEIILSVIFSLTPAPKQSLWERGQEAVLYRNIKDNQQIKGITYRKLSLSEIDDLVYKNILPPLETILQHSQIGKYAYGGIRLFSNNPRFILNSGSGKTNDFLQILYAVKKRLKEQYKILIDIQIDQIGV